MENDIAVRVNNVSMTFNLSTERVDNFKEFVIRRLQGKLQYETFHALNHISIEIKKGERVGILGLNGAGKSTLLKIIAGVMKPTEGTVELDGDLVPLLELGAGFDKQYTGSENIYLYGAMLGYSKALIDEKYTQIVRFARLKKFMDIPIKNYSSGMAARLGFAIATMVRPDILICDEVLAVGDYAFQRKCEQRMGEMREQGTTLLYVSHSIESVKSVCNHALWLDKGVVKMAGDVEVVGDTYISALQ